MHNPPEVDARQAHGVPDSSEWVAGLYERVLGVRGVGGEDDFFLLGGTSLSAMELLDLIEKERGIQLPVRDFYRATVVADLAREVDARGADSTGGA